MKKVLLVVSLISVLLLAGCSKNGEVNNNVNNNNNVPEVVTENQPQEEIVRNVEIDNNEEQYDDTLDISQSINIAEVLSRNGISISTNMEDNREYNYKIGDILLEKTKKELSLIAKQESQIFMFSLKMDDDIIYEGEGIGDFENATLTKFKNYLVLACEFDFSGGNIYIIDENGEVVYESYIGTKGVEIKNDVMYYSVEYGKLLEETLDGRKKYAREDYEIREENGSFTRTLINVDENDIVFGSAT